MYKAVAHTEEIITQQTFHIQHRVMRIPVSRDSPHFSSTFPYETVYLGYYHVRGEIFIYIYLRKLEYGYR